MVSAGHTPKHAKNVASAPAKMTNGAWNNEALTGPAALNKARLNSS